MVSNPGLYSKHSSIYFIFSSNPLPINDAYLMLSNQNKLFTAVKVPPTIQICSLACVFMRLEKQIQWPGYMHEDPVNR